MNLGINPQGMVCRVIASFPAEHQQVEGRQKGNQANFLLTPSHPLSFLAFSV